MYPSIYPWFRSWSHLLGLCSSAPLYPFIRSWSHLVGLYRCDVRHQVELHTYHCCFCCFSCKMLDLLGDWTREVLVLVTWLWKVSAHLPTAPFRCLPPPQTFSLVIPSGMDGDRSYHRTVNKYLLSGTCTAAKLMIGAVPGLYTEWLAIRHLYSYRCDLYSYRCGYTLMSI